MNCEPARSSPSESNQPCKPIKRKSPYLLIAGVLGIAVFALLAILIPVPLAESKAEAAGMPEVPVGLIPVMISCAVVFLKKFI